MNHFDKDLTMYLFYVFDAAFNIVGTVRADTAEDALAKAKVAYRFIPAISVQPAQIAH
jgi:hypothetical protein